MSSSAKCTVREVKKRSKKSRTLPGRLKLLTGGGSCTNVSGSAGRDDGDDRSVTPPPNHHQQRQLECSTTGGRRAAKSSKSKLSVFKTPEGQHWCFDVDAYGIYMDFNGEFMRRSSSKDELRPGSVSGGEFMMGRDHNDNTSTSSCSTRSKSLTRQSCVSGGKNILSTSLSSSTRSMSRTRSRSRLQTMNNSLSQCFGFGGSSGHLKKGSSAHCDSSNHASSDSEEYGSDVYVRSVPTSSSTSANTTERSTRRNLGSSQHFNLDKTLSGSSAFGDLGDDEERYYPSG